MLVYIHSLNRKAPKLERDPQLPYLLKSQLLQWKNRGLNCIPLPLFLLLVSDPTGIASLWSKMTTGILGRVVAIYCIILAFILFVIFNGVQIVRTGSCASLADVYVLEE